MSLDSQAQCLESLNKLECTERVQAGAQITENLNTDANSESNGAEGLPELQTVVTLRRLNELGETLGVLAPVEFSGIDDDTSDGGAVAANPFGGGSNDDVSAWDGVLVFVKDLDFKGNGE